MSLRLAGKIIAPAAMGALVLALCGSYAVAIVGGLVSQQFESRMQSAGMNVNERLIDLEGRQVELVRLMASTEGTAQALRNGDATALQQLLRPLQANSAFNFVDAVRPDGGVVFAIRPNTLEYEQTLDTGIGTWDVTRKSLSGESDDLGNKWSQVLQTSFGPMLYTGGPVMDDANRVVGAILVGLPLDDLTAQMAGTELASVSLYDTQGKLLATSLSPGPAADVANVSSVTLNLIMTSDPLAMQRQVTIAGTRYTELMGGLVVRNAVGGVVGIGVPASIIERARRDAQRPLEIAALLGAMAVAILGILLARSTANRTAELTRVCRAIEMGDLSQRAQVGNGDELDRTARTLNGLLDEIARLTAKPRS